MALLAENIVEEWLNRQRFFTIRGVRDTINEMDILAIRSVSGNKIECWHVEVQVSFRPQKYISDIPKYLMDEINAKSRTSMKTRTEAQLKKCVPEWANKKFLDKGKVSRRNSLVNNATWKYVLVHAEVKDEKELKFLKNDMHIELIPFKKILKELFQPGKGDFTAAPAGDISEILNYHTKKNGNGSKE